MSHLLSDRRRPIVLTLVLAQLLLLCAWWAARPPRPERPAPGVMSLVTVVSIVEGDGFEVASGLRKTPVSGPTADLRIGDEVTLLGSWDGEARRFEADEVVPAEDRSGKKRLGIVGLLMVGALLPAWFRLGPGGLAVHG